MGFLKELIKKYAGVLVIPLWTGLLAYPFTGRDAAIRLAVTAAVLIILWNLLHLSGAKEFLGDMAGRIGRLRMPLPEVVSSKAAPALVTAFVLFLILFPFLLNNYYRDVMTLTGMYVVLALGLNLIVGQAGLLNLGFAAFYAVGAYTYAILSTSFGVSFWAGLAAGAGMSALFAALVGVPTLKLRGDYFAIVTLGLGEITRIILNNWDAMTGGPNGISRIGKPVLMGYTLHTTLDFYYLILAIAMITVFVTRRLMSSRIGRAWIAIREDEIAAEAMGVNAFRLKLLALVLGSACAGVAGVFFASKMAFVSPESFTFSESVLILCMVVLGGMGSIPGIILGALLLIALPEVFREFQDYRMLAFGAALVLMMIFRPQGMLGQFKKAA